jgi:hypothetical protein
VASLRGAGRWGWGPSKSQAPPCSRARPQPHTTTPSMQRTMGFNLFHTRVHVAPRHELFLGKGKWGSATPRGGLRTPIHPRSGWGSTSGTGGSTPTMTAPPRCGPQVSAVQVHPTHPKPFSVSTAQVRGLGVQGTAHVHPTHPTPSARHQRGGASRRGPSLGAPSSGPSPAHSPSAALSSHGGRKACCCVWPWVSPPCAHRLNP